MAGSDAAFTAPFPTAQAEVVEQIASGAPLEHTLHLLVYSIQQKLPGAMAAVLLLSADGQSLHLGAAPDLPAAFHEAVDGLRIGPTAGSCGTAAFTRSPVIVTDTATDERWAGWRELALRHALRAGWSTPIPARNGGVLGTFAVYWREPRTPAAPEADIIRMAVNLAAVAIEGSRFAALQRANEGKWRAVFEHALDAILIADDRRRFVDANAAACELFNAPRSRIVGSPISEFMSRSEENAGPESPSNWASFLSNGCQSGECVILRADGTRRFADLRARANFQPGLHLCIVRDTTERKLTEEAVRCAEGLYRTLVETTNTGYLVADHEGRVLDANAEYVRLAGQSDLNAIRGQSVLQWTVPEDRARHAEGIAACLRGELVRDLEVHFAGAEGQAVPVEINATAVRAESGLRFLSLCRDITTRVAARQEVETAWHGLETRVLQRTAQLASANEQIRMRARQQEAVAEIGRRALAEEDLARLLQQACELVAQFLEVDFTAVMEHADEQSEDLLLRACHGWAGTLGEPIATTNPVMLAGYVIASREPVVFGDLGRETRFQPLPGMLESGIVSGMTVVIPGETRPFGVMCAQSLQTREFTQDDVHFLQSVANVLAAAVARTRAESIVRLAREAAVNANDAKLEFLSRMSHELRTPLNAILGFGQLLEIDELNPTQRESVDQIISAGRHLLHLVNEVLDISRIESGNWSFELEPLQVAELLGEAIDLIRPLATANEIELIMTPAAREGAQYVLADRQRVRQVLLNLLSNAVKYNRPAGSVTVSDLPAPDGRSIRLQIADTGNGIAPEHLSRLFTPFDRLGAENTRVEGSGIGLALSKRLIEAQGGRLGVDSIVGNGSVFWVDLPIAAAPLTGSNHSLFDEMIKPFLTDHENSADAGSPACDGAVPARTILYVEDNEPNRRLMEMLLLQRPCLRLVTASRGREGIEIAHLHPPDLILLDMHLPDISGEEVLNALRAEPATRETPVVVVSADATALRQASLRGLGANDYLTKPFNVMQFLSVVDEYLVPEESAAVHT